MGVNGGETLYGRRNVLSDPDGRPLAEVVEILPPAEPTAIVEERNA
jgi:hypothetical protein